MYNFSDTTLDALLDYAYNQPGKKTHHITRLAMYQALQGLLASVDGPGKRCLAMSSSAKIARLLGLRETQIVRASYPEHNMVDLRFHDGEFDFCVSDQVLEHVEGNPFRAFSESARVIRPGGHVCHTTCFINQVHGAPKDFWRFTPDALDLMATESGLEVVKSGGWGNRDLVGLMRSKFRMCPIPDDPKNPIYQLALRNERDWPVVVWVVARKPLVDAAT